MLENKNKLSRFVCGGGFFLTLVSGIINAIGFLSFAHQGVTHMTGITTRASLAYFAGEFNSALFLSFLVFSFFLGAVISGAIVLKSSLQVGRHYGVVLILESLLLFIAVPFLMNESCWGEGLIACACGMQNAMASTYGGSILRTTHVTGILTDLGVWVGNFLRRIKLSKQVLIVYLTLLSGFFIGGILGAELFVSLNYFALLVPAALTGLFGIVYIAFLSKEFIAAP